VLQLGPGKEGIRKKEYRGTWCFASEYFGGSTVLLQWKPEFRTCPAKEALIKSILDERRGTGIQKSGVYVR
jgi:hypothetical protein